MNPLVGWLPAGRPSPAGTVAAVAAGLAVLLATSPGPSRGRLVDLRRHGGDALRPVTGTAAGPGRGLLVAVAALGLAVTGHLIAAVTAVAATLAGPRIKDRVRSSRSDALVRRGAALTFTALAAELRAGRPLPAALEAAALDAPARLAVRLRAAARLTAAGTDGAPALTGPGDPVAVAALRPLAGVLAVVHTGAALALTVDRLARAARSEQRVRDALEVELAGPRATALLLAALPVGGVLLAGTSGAHPVAVLTRTPVGLGCLVAGLVLELAGLAWARRIVRSVTP